MLKFLGQLILSFVITNWVYSEVCLFYPPARQLGDRVTAVLRLPTHNEWAGIASSNEAEVLERNIGEQLAGSPLLSRLFLDSQVKNTWRTGPARFFSSLLGERSSAQASAVSCGSHIAGGFFVCPSLYESFDGELPFLIANEIETF